MITVKPVCLGHLETYQKCPDYQGVWLYRRPHFPVYVPVYTRNKGWLKVFMSTVVKYYVEIQVFTWLAKDNYIVKLFI